MQMLEDRGDVRVVAHVKALSIACESHEDLNALCLLFPHFVGHLYVKGSDI